MRETFTQTYPYNPAVSAKSRSFIAADASDGTNPIKYYRFRSAGAPVLTSFSSALAGLIPPSYACLYHYWAPATFYFEETGTVTYQKALTIQSNDGPNDLNGAINLVIQHLKDLKYIN